jgi:hypothetical protein
MPVSDSQDPPLSQDSPHPKRKKNRHQRPRKSRWRKWLWVLLVLGILTLLANGPIFRWLGKKAIVKAFGTIGLTGDLVFEGSILGGPVLADARFTGDNRLGEIAFTRAEIDYSLGAALKRDWPRVVEKVILENPRIRIDKSRPPVAKKKTASPKTKEPGDPWSFTAFRDVRVDLTGLDFEILRRDASDRPEWQIKNASLSLADGGTGKLTVGSILFPDGRAYADLQATLQIHSENLALSGPTLGDQLAIETLSLAKPSVDSSAVFTLDAKLRIFGGTVTATHLQGSSVIQAELTSGTIDLAGVTAMFGVKGIDAATLEKLKGTITFPPRPTDGSKATPPAIDANVRVTDFQGYKLPFPITSAASDIRLANRFLSLANTVIEIEGNDLTGSTGARLPEKGAGAKGWLDTLEGNLAFEGEETTRLLAAFSIPFEAKAGLKLDFAFNGGVLEKLEGNLHVTEIAKGEARAEALHLGLHLASPDVIRADLALEIDSEKSNRAKLDGTFALDTFDYSAKLDLALADLTKLEPAAAEFGAKNLTLSGDAHLFWEGSGTLDPNLVPRHEGEATLSPSTVSLNGGNPIKASLHANYDPDTIEIKELAATLGDLAIGGAAQWDASVLTVTGLRVLRDGTELARADAAVPLSKTALSSPEDLFSQDGSINLNVKSTALPLEEIFQALNQESKARGSLTADITAAGTFAEPVFKGSLDIDRLAIVGLDNVKSGTLHLGIDIADKKAALDGSLTHPDINPISITARAPFAPREWIETPESMKRAGIQAEISLPDNPLAVIQPLLPDAKTVEGQFSARLSIAGTLTAPVVTGSLKVAAPVIAFQRQKIPTVRDIDVDLQFAGQTLEIRTLDAELAGGPISITGQVGLADPRAPSLDIALSARQVLVARDDDLSIRANADLTLVGPFASATLAGRIGITESRYFRNIEILPVGFLRPAAAPAARRVSFTPPSEPSIKAKPFDAWTLDVTLGTDHPFLVRGNRAEADIEGEIHVTGTGAAPVPEGAMRITKGEATLPFSKLGLEESSVTFSPATGFLSPQLNIIGLSETSSYLIELRVYGTATAPKYLLTSDPPLPQEDIISLLATGTTRSQLNDSNVLASKAAFLLLDELGKKIKDVTGSETPDLPLADRLDVDMGGTDPRTGQRTTTTTFKLTDKVHIVGAVDQTGNYRGLLKFLIRFD